MPEFHFKARDKKGKIVSGNRNAVALEELAYRLQEEHLIPLEIKTAKKENQSKSKLVLSRPKFFQAKVSSDELQMFCRQMHTLLKSRIPIFTAISRLSEATRDKQLMLTLTQLLDYLNKGQLLSQALSQFPAVFSNFYVNLIKVGENTGALDEIFLHLAQYIELETDITKKIKSAMRYPILVLSATLVALLVINAFVIPAFSQLFKDFKGELPLPTRILMASSNFILNYWYILLLLVIGFLWGFRFYIHTQAGGIKWSRLKLRIQCRI